MIKTIAAVAASFAVGVSTASATVLTFAFEADFLGTARSGPDAPIGDLAREASVLPSITGTIRVDTEAALTDDEASFGNFREYFTGTIAVDQLPAFEDNFTLSLIDNSSTGGPGNYRADFARIDNIIGRVRPDGFTSGQRDFVSLLLSQPTEVLPSLLLTEGFDLGVFTAGTLLIGNADYILSDEGFSSSVIFDAYVGFGITSISLQSEVPLPPAALLFLAPLGLGLIRRCA